MVGGPGSTRSARARSEEKKDRAQAGDDEGLELLSQCFDSLRDNVIHRVDLKVHDRGDIGIAQVIIEFQENSLALAFCQGHQTPT